MDDGCVFIFPLTAAMRVPGEANSALKGFANGHITHVTRHNLPVFFVPLPFPVHLSFFFLFHFKQPPCSLDPFREVQLSSFLRASSGDNYPSECTCQCIAGRWTGCY